jgi:hypothetical protein
LSLYLLLDPSLDASAPRQKPYQLIPCAPAFEYRVISIAAINAMVSELFLVFMPPPTCLILLVYVSVLLHTHDPEQGIWTIELDPPHERVERTIC